MHGMNNSAAAPGPFALLHFFFFFLLRGRAKLANLSQGMARMSERRQSQFGLKPPTRKWEVQKGKRRRKV